MSRAAMALAQNPFGTVYPAQVRMRMIDRLIHSGQRLLDFERVRQHMGIGLLQLRPAVALRLDG